MHRDFLFGIGLLASVAAGAGSAVAADLPVRPPPAAAPATCCAVPDWVGFYVGIHGGGGWGHKDFESGFFSTEPDDNPFIIPNNASLKGGVFGFSSATTGNGDRSSAVWKLTTAVQTSRSR